MLIDQISITGLRVFESVYRLKSMSKAAEELFMTQPGISQHISNMENGLDIKLFDRLNRKLVPTDSAHIIHEQISTILEQLEGTLNTISGKKKKLRGKIKLGLPIEFGNNVILPRLAKWSAKHPDVEFQINYDHVSRQMNQILDGTLDFAITDTITFPKQVEYQTLSKEQLVLCAGKDYAQNNKLTSKSSFKDVKELDYISYLEGAPVLRQWFKHHLGKNVDLNIKAQLMDVQGVARLIVENVGLGVLSMHMVKNHKLQEKIIILDGKGTPLYNGLNLVQLKGRTMGQASSDFIKYLLETFEEKLEYK